MDLPFRIAAERALHVPDIPFIHTDQEVKTAVIPADDLPRRMTPAIDPVRIQHPPRRRIDRTAKLFRTCRRGLYIEPVRHPSLLNHVLHQIFRDRAPANIAVADEQDADRGLFRGSWVHGEALFVTFLL